MIKVYILCLGFLLNIPSLAVQISWAQDASGRAVDAKVVPRENGPFVCFECATELILRRGEKLEAHFAHHPSAGGDCGGGLETWQHIYAKELLAKHLDKWRFVSKCRDCKVLKSSKKFLFTEGYTTHQEHSYDKFVVDVMVMRNKIPAAALELRYSHAVDEEKKSFFLSKRLPIIEVRAEQVIEAFESNTFEALIIDSGRCQQCEWKNRRPCIECKLWHSIDKLSKMIPPAGHRYASAFVCPACKAHCKGCNKTTTKEQIKNNNNCYSCGENIQKWNRESEHAIATKNLGKIVSLLENPPPTIDPKLLRAKHAEIAQELEQIALREQAQKRAQKEQEERAILEQWRADVQQAREVQNPEYMRTLLTKIPSLAHEEEYQELRQQECAIREQQEQAFLAQWRTEVEHAIHDKNCEQMRALLKSIPTQASQEEGSELQQQLFKNDPAWQVMLKTRAKEIVATQYIYLKVPLEDREEVDRYYAQWEKEDIYKVSIAHIQNCAKWLADSKEVIPVVMALQEEAKVQRLQKKRTNTTVKTLAPKKQRITNFFKANN